MHFPQCISSYGVRVTFQTRERSIPREPVNVVRLKRQLFIKANFRHGYLYAIKFIGKQTSIDTYNLIYKLLKSVL